MKSRKKYFQPGNLQVFLWIFLIMQAGQSAYTQGRNEEVTIIAPYIPTIGEASKIPFRPEITVKDTAAPSFEYNYVSRDLATRMEIDAVEPLRYSDSKQEDLYRNYAKIGMGNYWTPYIEFLASSLQSEKYHAGARIRHHSSKGGVKGFGPADFSHNLASVYAKTFLKSHTLSGSLLYHRDVVHFYGYPADSFPELDISKDDLRQRFQHMKASMAFGSNYTPGNRLNHFFRLDYNYFSDIFKTRESQIDFLTNLSKNFASRRNNFDHSFGLDIKLEYLNFKDSSSTFKPTYIEIKPVYTFSIGQYLFYAGVHVDIVNEPSQSDNELFIDAFPTLGAEIIILENKLKAYIDFSGELTVNSFRHLVYTNPFITSTPELRSTDEHIRIQGGISGNAGGMNFLAQASYSYISDMPLFVTDNSVTLKNKFLVIYDDMNLLNVKASLGYNRINNLTTRLTAEYNHYVMNNEEKAWQMPDFEISLDAAYRLREKYLFKSSVLMLGKKYARTFNEGTVVPSQMDGAFDLSIGFEYKINQMITGFIDGNNLLNKQYQRWYNYPVQGIQVMLGAKFSF